MSPPFPLSLGFFSTLVTSFLSQQLSSLSVKILILGRLLNHRRLLDGIRKTYVGLSSKANLASRVVARVVLAFG